MSKNYFIEGNIYQANEVPEKLIIKQYFEPSSNAKQYKARVSGLSIIDNQTYLFLPKNTQNHVSVALKDELGKLTFKSLLKYRNENQLRSEERYWLGHESSNAELVDIIKWLINDYKNNGIFKEEVRYESNDLKDRIQWNRTIKNQFPFIIDEQLFFPKLITNNNKINTDSLITAIHKNVINEITHVYGWLFQVDVRNEYVNINLSNTQIIRILKGELDRTQHSRIQLLIINIINYLVNYELKHKTFDLVTPYFEYVWEGAISSIFEDNKDLHKKVGKPYWRFKDGTIRTNTQLPDTLVSMESKLVIIDAKYYSMDADYKLNLPGWNSVVKQLYYNLSIKVDYKEKENMFLLPDLSLDNNLFNYIGLTSVDDFEEDLGVVYAFRVNTGFVLSSYLDKKNRKNFLTKLF